MQDIFDVNDMDGGTPVWMTPTGPGAQGGTSYHMPGSAYGAFSYSLKVQITVEGFTLNLSGERYLSNQSTGIWSGLASPALVDFTRLSFGISYTF